MQSQSEPKFERIDIRTNSTVKRLLQQAAAASHKSVSEFLLEHGLIAASETLANRRLFMLDDEQWQAFQAALDRPPQDKPRLRRLLTEPSVFDWAIPLTKPYIEKLSAARDCQDFDCGQPELNRFLLRYALQNQQSNRGNIKVKGEVRS